MAEIIEREDVYTELREFMDAMPGGFPATESGMEMKILHKLFTPDEAKMTLFLTTKLETAETISERSGMEMAQVKEKLESMAMKGLIFKTREDGEDLYRAEQYVVGVYEYQLPTMDRELAELMEDYFLYLGMSMLANDTPQMRVVPVNSAVEAAPAAASYDQIRDLVREQQVIMAGECICRKQQSLLANACGKPFEGCMGFGSMAEFYLDRGLGRKVSVEEALKVLGDSEEAGLVLIPNNAQHIDFVCSCCSCCCGLLKTIKEFPNPAEFVESTFHAWKDLDKCSECDTCVERCPMGAMVEGDEATQVDLARCIGCGLCVSTCKEEAISLVRKAEAVTPPLDMEDMLHRISVERGLA
jgi:electron transport complex protein RnfB